ncbi:hypothetical protein F2P81_001542 [Scophthalmus maximus]|uniref:Uncharacterized protein n=1 Tax=Scophthalmus maximus TaxID=52904 RepID=A0A6A4TGE0_SCOMX|nr:hypothetical protein F2P81_001542 [Scophthalmus maximus]
MTSSLKSDSEERSPKHRGLNDWKMAEIGKRLGVFSASRPFRPHGICLRSDESASGSTLCDSQQIRTNANVNVKVGSLQGVYSLADSRGRSDRATFEKRLPTAEGREMDLVTTANQSVQLLRCMNLYVYKMLKVNEATRMKIQWISRNDNNDASYDLRTAAQSKSQFACDFQVHWVQKQHGHYRDKRDPVPGRDHRTAHTQVHLNQIKDVPLGRSPSPHSLSSLCKRIFGKKLFSHFVEFSQGQYSAGGFDLNVMPVWSNNITGHGVVVSIVDDARDVRKRCCSIVTLVTALIDEAYDYPLASRIKRHVTCCVTQTEEQWSLGRRPLSLRRSRIWIHRVLYPAPGAGALPAPLLLSPAHRVILSATASPSLFSSDVSSDPSECVLTDTGRTPCHVKARHVLIGPAEENGGERATGDVVGVGRVLSNSVIGTNLSGTRGTILMMNFTGNNSDGAAQNKLTPTEHTVENGDFH